MSKVVDVVVSYLELEFAVTPADESWRRAQPLIRREPANSAGVVSAAMYRAVGGAWYWTDRLGWAAAEWDAAVNRDDVEVWVAQVGDAVAGYFELHVEAAAVELKYFGLVPEFTGRGIGGPLLDAAIDRARALGRSRMTVNTCTLDHPSALPNYRKRGFVLARAVTERRTLPA